MPTPKVNSWLGWRIFTVNSGAPPYARRSRPGTTAASSPSAAVTPEVSHSYKYPAFPATLPRHLRRRCRAAPLPAFHGRATAHVPSLYPIEPSRATCCLGRARVVAGAEPPRPPPSVLAVRPRRRVLCPNTGHPQALGEPTDVPRRFPGPERGRLAGIWPAPPPPMAKGQIASPQLFLRCFV
jgi:hypothetical protein